MTQYSFILACEQIIYHVNLFCALASIPMRVLFFKTIGRSSDSHGKNPARFSSIATVCTLEQASQRPWKEINPATRHVYLHVLCSTKMYMKAIQQKDKPVAAILLDLITHQTVDFEFEVSMIDRIIQRHLKRRVTKVLTVNCSTGNHSILLAKKGYEVTGIDSSEEMLSLARSKTAGFPHPPQFYRMDMRQIRFAWQFDVGLLLSGSFGHLTVARDLEQFLAGIRRHLPNGLLVFEFWQPSGVDAQSRTNQGRLNWDKAVDSQSGNIAIRLTKAVYQKSKEELFISIENYYIDPQRERLLGASAEHQKLKLYNTKSLVKILKRAGFSPEAFYALDAERKSIRAPKETDLKLLCVARVLQGKPKHVVKR